MHKTKDGDGRTVMEIQLITFVGTVSVFQVSLMAITTCMPSSLHLWLGSGKALPAPPRTQPHNGYQLRFNFRKEAPFHFLILLPKSFQGEGERLNLASEPILPPGRPSVTVITFTRSLMESTWPQCLLHAKTQLPILCSLYWQIEFELW